MAFTTNNTAPDLVGRDNNFSVDLFLANKSAGLDQDSTSGWHRAGGAGIGSYDSDFTTSVNSTMMGTTKVPKSFHINEQNVSISITLGELTPFGLEIQNKTTLTPTVTYGTVDTTVAASGAGTQTITLSSGTGISAGTMLEFAMSTGDAAYKAYGRVDSISSDTIVLELPLDEEVADAAVVKDVTKIRNKKGGVTLKQRSIMPVISGDNGDTLVHYALDTVVTSGKQAFPDANAGTLALQIGVIPQTELIDGKNQPILLEEDLVFG